MKGSGKSKPICKVGKKSFVLGVKGEGCDSSCKLIFTRCRDMLMHLIFYIENENTLNIILILI